MLRVDISIINRVMKIKLTCKHSGFHNGTYEARDKDMRRAKTRTTAQ